MATFEKSADEPITTSKADKFGRANFAKGLAEALVKVPNSESFTVGLYGAWGSGKTSVIKMAEEYLAKNHKDDVIVINFNPWLFTTIENLHTAFFGALAHGLNKKIDSGISIDLQKYTELTGTAGAVIAPFFPPAPMIARILSAGMRALSGNKSNKSTDELRQKIDNILRDSKKRVIVIIDDIDRLDSEEIHQIFKLAKNAGRFSNVSYLLAFDQNVVAKALAQRYPEEPEIGSNFVDKIVQLPLFVPPVDREMLSQFIIDQINVIATKHKLDNSADDVSRFGTEYQRLLAHQFTTPRKAIRYLNVIDFTFERLANEANFTDVMLVEAMRVFDPELYSRIASKKSVLIDRGHYSNRDDDDKKKAKLEVFGTEEIASWQGTIVRELFPSFEWALGGSSYAGDYVKGWDEEQRVCSDKYFDRYFNYGIPVGDVADAKIKEFLALLENHKTTQDEANKVLAKLVAAGHPDVLISKLRNKEDSYSQVVAEKLAYALVSLGNTLPRPRQTFLGDTFSSYVQSAILAVSLTRKSSDTVKMLKDFIAAAPLDYAEQLVRWIRADTENQDKKEDFVPLITEAQLKEIGELFAKRIKDYSDSNDLINNFAEELPSILWNWNNWGKQKDIEAYIKKAVAADVNNANTFIISYTGNAFELGSGRRSRSEFRRESYNEIAKFVDPGVFIEPLKKLHGDDIDANLTEFPSGRFNKTESEDRLTAKQFIYVHGAAVAEDKDGASDD
jgi:predicted KAP-like P-loop ATPase